MKKSVLILFVISVCLLTFQCKKEKEGCTDPMSISYDADAEEDDGSCQYGGTGGSTTIVAKPEHHGDPIVGQAGYVDSAFIKFNTQDSPGINPSAYDLVVAGEPGEDHVHIENMKPGKYYIYMTGFDSAYMMRVFGGIPVIITAAAGEVDVVVPVSE